MSEKSSKTDKDKSKNNKKAYKTKRRFRVNKKIDGKSGSIFVGLEDPFLYFPDMMSYFSREEIDEVHLKARGKSISNAVNVAEQFKNRFKKEIQVEVKNVEIGTEEVPRKDRKGKIRMSFIDITMIKNTQTKD
tara:strand:+ start:385 stop:783 length:399 start_codon:yes stop_codon:yes gene_type:complete